MRWWRELREWMRKPLEIDYYAAEREPEEQSDPADYYCEKVSRDTYAKTELGDPWPTDDAGPTGVVIDGIYDSGEDQHILVIRI